MVATHKPSRAKQSSSRGSAKPARTGEADFVVRRGDSYIVGELKSPKDFTVVKRGESYVVGGTEAKKLVGTTSSRAIQGSPNKGRLSAREVSSLVKRMKVAA